MEKDAVPFLEYLVHHRISKMNLNYEYGKMEITPYKMIS